MDGNRLVIIGGVAAGTKVAARARRENPELDITLITRESHISYAGCGMPYYLGGIIKNKKELLVKSPREFEAEMNVKVLTEHEAVSVLPGEQIVEIVSNRTGEKSAVSFDRLVLATGATPFIPPIPGAGLSNVFTLRTVEDAVAIRDRVDAGHCRKAAIVGAGLIGLEVAENLHLRGIDVSLVELDAQILPGYDRDVARLVEKHIREQGVTVHTGTRVLGLLGDGEVSSVSTDKGDLPADTVILSVGIRPNASLAAKAGISLGPTGAISVNGAMETSVPGVYAVGDCAENSSLVTGAAVWYPMGSTANKAGRIAGTNVARKEGPKQVLKGVLGTSIVKVFECTVARTGLSEKEARTKGFDVETVLAPSPDRAHYYPGNKEIITKLIADKASGKVLGGQVLGEGVVDKPIDILATAITFGATVKDLTQLDLAYSPPFSSAMASTLVAANVLENKLEGRFRGISAEGVRDRVDDPGTVVVDVRTPEEFMLCAIPGSLNIPLSQLEARHQEIDGSKEIIIACKVGKRAYQAYLTLKRLGFDSVAVLEGGVKAYPFETE
jgi:NADPH-dependent 2,4-dienoyl-CoA reductase/sulfur reductase-like enzyme/rhodanese-related sulfurtransferase